MSRLDNDAYSFRRNFLLNAHLIDQALLLFGCPTGVYADLRLQRDGAAAADNVEVHLQYPSVKVVLKAGSLVCEPSPRFTLRGTEGSFTKYGLDPQEEALKLGMLPTQPGWGTEPEEVWGVHSCCDGDLIRKKYPTLPGRYQDYYENVFQTLAGQQSLAVRPEQARDTIRVIEVAEQSAVEKKVVSW